MRQIQLKNTISSPYCAKSVINYANIDYFFKSHCMQSLFFFRGLKLNKYLITDCSRFWVCEPDLSDCLHECPKMPGGGWLFFDFNIDHEHGGD